MEKFKNRTCIVTGAARGIGREIASDLLNEGANVVLGDMSPNTPEVATELGRILNCSERVFGFCVDVTKREQVKEMIEATVSKFGELHVKFNNAGVNKPMNFLDITESNWDFIMKVNGLGVLIGTQEAAKQMIKQGKGGKIINTASIAGRQGFDNVAPYCASKFAVISLTQSAARDLAKHKITVNGFAPGVVDTPLWEQLDKDLMELGASQKPGQAMQDFSADILMGRPAKPQDIVGITRYLAGPDSDYVTGQVMMVDGGMILV